MEKGEWTKTQALVLASALEGFQLAQDLTSLSGSIFELVSQVKSVVRKETENSWGGYHQEIWIVELRQKYGSIHNPTAEVELLCYGDSGPIGHDWMGRKVTIVIPETTRPGQTTITHRSDVGKSLEFQDFDIWDAYDDVTPAE